MSWKVRGTLPQPKKWGYRYPRIYPRKLRLWFGVYGINDVCHWMTMTYCYWTAAVDACENLQQAMTGANTVRPLTRETRRRVADRGGVTTFTRRPRTNFTAEQLRHLRQCFADCQYIDVHQRAKISTALGLTENQARLALQFSCVNIYQEKAHSNTCTHYTAV